MPETSLKPRYVLGISAYYHDSAAALLKGGEIVAAAQEERFTRKKHDSRFPTHAIKYCLEQQGITVRDLEAAVFYDKPLVKFERILETYFTVSPRGFSSFLMAMPVWIKDKLFLKTTLKREIAELGGLKASEIPSLLFAEHHQSHAASAFFPSPFERAAVLCLDGVGEWATTSVWLGEGNKLTPKWQIDFPHSLGLLYSAFTYFTGFKVNSGEYKLMGLAPYGEPKYVDLILKELIDLKSDGTFRLNMKYFNFATGLTMTNAKFAELFGGPARKAEGQLTTREMDIARSIQAVTEEVVLRLARTIQKELAVDYLCLAGGVALNCVANGKLIAEGIFKDVWIQPAAGDAGGSLGAAFAGWYQFLDNPRQVEPADSMRGSFLGPRYELPEVETYLKTVGAKYEAVPDQDLADKVATVLADGSVVGWFQGRMEFGPRALGARSIIGDARSTSMQSTMNLKIKYRESFRPFAPAVLADRVKDYFELDARSPYMLVVAPVKKELRRTTTEQENQLFGIEKLNVPRSAIPAVTHVDYSARVQTIHKESNPRFHDLVSAFADKTGCGVIINTSFNVRGEPIVCTPADAYRCFMRTEMDYLVIENCIMRKGDQPPFADSGNWKDEYELD